MEKSTKLIIAALGLGGLGYFLYKKGLFNNNGTVTMETKDSLTKVDTGKKTAVEPPEEVVKIQKPLPSQPVYTDPVYTPPISSQPSIIYPKDELYPVEQKIFTYPTDNFYYQPVSYDQPTRVDYTTGKYNQDITYDYMNKDIVNVRLNQYLYA